MRGTTLPRPTLPRAPGPNLGTTAPEARTGPAPPVGCETGARQASCGPMKRAARIAVFLLCVGFSVAAVVNVFGDNTEVKALAKEIACEGVPVKPIPPTAPPGTRPSDCAVSETRSSRTPFGQSFEFTGKAGTKKIGCTRSLIFVGEYSCKAE